MAMTAMSSPCSPTSYSANTAYIRIGARNIDQYSVITVNEPIE